MNKLWAPWRIKYIKTAAKKQSGCLFCRSKKSKRNSYIFLKNRYCFAMLNIFPYNNGHVLISPTRHTGDLKTIKQAEVAEIFKMLQEVIRLLDKTLKPQGYNIGMNIGKCSGAGIPGHLHIHIVPRWQADTNFMPVLSNTKIISQSLNELYRTLKKISKP
ncbi:MAG: HIT domain-containing protein [Candidatus Omnitrophota bacterium]